MSLPDELQSLAALKAKGALTEQEFAQAKAEVIAKYGGTSTATPAFVYRTTSVATAVQHKLGPIKGPGTTCPGCNRVIGQGDCLSCPAPPFKNSEGFCRGCYSLLHA